MGGLHRHPLNGLGPASASRSIKPAPPHVPVLTNAAVAPGCRLLSLDGCLQQTADLADPLDGITFDTIIVNPDDYVTMLDVLLAL
jgi:hypothetical protein